MINYISHIKKIIKSTIWNAAFLTSLLLIIVAFTGCSQVKTPITKSGIYFDTVISITLYEPNSSKLIDECFSLAETYENLFSKTISDSDVSRVNSSYNQWIGVNEETFSIITHSFEYEDLSEGRFSVMCGALTGLWDIGNQFESEKSIIPTESEIITAKKVCGKETLDIDENTHSVRINTMGAKLDLGAVAKGYIADQMKTYLLSKGVKSGIIQLGGNVLLIGENPTKNDGLYTIGINEPFSEDGSVITAVSEKDNSIVTSGNYQRFFEHDGNLYHHIIDLKTGYPADTGLNSVSIVTKESYDADALSTVCFLLGKDKASELINSINNTNNTNTSAIFIDSNNQILN